MLDYKKFIKRTETKSVCSCARGKKCSGCKKKKVIKPYITVEEPKRLPVPIIITPYTTTVQYADKHTNFWNKKKKAECPFKGNPVCRWFKRRKALKDLKKINQREGENDRLDLQRLVKDYYETRQQKNVHYEPTETKKPKIKKPKVKKTKQKKYDYYQPTVTTQKEKKYDNYEPPAINYASPPKKKQKSVKVKTIDEKKLVPVTKYKYREPISQRFVNCCYRFCCQLYCYLTCIIIIACVIIFVI